MVRGKGEEKVEEKIKTDRRKTLKNEDKEKRRIQGNQITTTYIFGFVKKQQHISLKNIAVKGKKVKSSSYHHISFTDFMSCRISETQ